MQLPERVVPDREFEAGVVRLDQLAGRDTLAQLLGEFALIAPGM